MDDEVLVSSGDVRVELLRLLRDVESPTKLLMAAPGHLKRDFDGRAEIVGDTTRRISRRAAFNFRRACFEQFAAEIDALRQTAANEELLVDWLGRLSQGRAEVWHRPDVPVFTRAISHPTRTAVTSGPLNPVRAAGNDDLEFELLGDAHRSARLWFQRHLESSDNVSADYARLIEESWAGPYVTPLDLYYKVLTEYFALTIEGMDAETDNNPMLDYLTEFQRDAYEYGKSILRRFGGVFLADVVGLGKTFIGLALLKHLQERYDEHPVVVAPPKVCHQWRELAEEFRVELVTVSHGNLGELDRHRSREVLLIDESHNFRNTGTLRYEQVTRWLRPDDSPSNTKVLLLSATPQNNRPLDVKHQLEFFPDTYARLPYRDESLDAWFQAVERGAHSLSDLLQHVVVRRTRTFIRRNYPNAILTQRNADGEYESIPLTFPKRVSGDAQALRYSIEAVYGEDLYRRILEVLGEMSYPQYNLAEYVRPEFRALPDLVNLRRTGKSLRGLFKVLLLKRLESSTHAFAITIGRLLEKLRQAVHLLEQGHVRIRQTERAPADEDELLDDVDAEVSATWFEKERLADALEADITLLTGLVRQVRDIPPNRDAKLQVLNDYFRARAPAAHRTIVFTQFADTAIYLHNALKDSYGRVELVTGSLSNALAVTRRFAPRANRADVPPDQQVELLISTDALSEGVNLQDADTLINYDLHWNPVRLIQRAGRIDRIGSPNDEIHITSFLPERGLEAELGLEAVLRQRIAEFLHVFGEDSAILPTSEALNDEIVLSSYSGAALEASDEDSDLDGLSRHAERLLTLRRDDPETFNRVLSMRPGRRAVSAVGQSIVATRVGWHWAFWSPSSSGAPRRLDDDQDGLDQLFFHANGSIADSPDEQQRTEFGDLLQASMAEFEGEAQLLAQRRRRPRLSPTEDYLVSQLEEFRRECLLSEQPLVDRLLDAVRAGSAQAQVRRVCRGWKKQKLPPRTVFAELRVVLDRHPHVEEQFGEPLLVGAVLSTSQRIG